MTALSLEQKLTQYHEFFAIEHEFSVNIMTIDNTEATSFEQFSANTPIPFKLATDMSVIDQSALRSLQNLGNSASQLVNFLNQQSQKIDLLIGYILSQQDEVQHRYQGVKFGGGGIKFIAPMAFSIGQLLELKIFLLESNCAIYCYGEVIAVEAINELFTHKVTFHYIREEDREILVRSSLHEQSKHLQKLAKLRNQDNEQ
ncbi:PilZ domain-containing protein [Colwellia psychrerythraea]|uniref:Type IV pilus assembly PilZ n=1 Tax=Colwellia psychrerythraea TaxID=28229 RepID=A0A099L2L6_COLPS|nr:PilZ domain-containing protein [Colwellia psychrerythraea]KGJ96093.1 type IV pilus assembly PilZ [Colwellia psychrerythraea]